MRYLNINLESGHSVYAMEVCKTDTPCNEKENYYKNVKFILVFMSLQNDYNVKNIIKYNGEKNTYHIKQADHWHQFVHPSTKW